MTANFLVILLIVLIVIVYSNLNSRIQKLEKKISDLQENTPKDIPVAGLKKRIYKSISAIS
ncbi:hypothetical protein [Chryseobacterium proteolyticum]|uniref:hypothetical protein n=1 Tax=Chryseobacterium proteolyticum TaxID=118127 RepID=UPI0039837DA6